MEQPTIEIDQKLPAIGDIIERNNDGVRYRIYEISGKLMWICDPRKEKPYAFQLTMINEWDFIHDYTICQK